MTKRALSIATTATLIFTSTLGLGVFASTAASGAEKETRYIVQLAPTASVASQNAIAANATSKVDQLGGDVEDRLDKVYKGLIVSLPNDRAASQLLNDPNVVSVVKDKKVRLTLGGTQNPTTSWGLDRIDQAALPRNNTFKYATTGEGVRVYIVDTGVRPDHADYAGRLLSGYTTIEDGLGTADCHGHGTHVAGTAAGTSYGVAKTASIVPVRVLDCNGDGFMSDVLLGLDWISANNPAGTRAVVNMSLTGEGSFAPLETAISNAMTNNIIVVVAAGNANADACNYTPARTPAAITVASTTSSDARSNFSNFGSCVDIFAPGTGITSASHTGGINATSVKSGTSMAAPHVAGMIAGYLQRFPTATSAQTVTAMNNLATNNVVTDVQGSPNRLLRALYSVADPATGVTGTVGNGSVTVNWTAPVYNGGDFQGYAVYYSTNNGASYITANPNTNSAATSFVVPNLTNGTSYRFAVATVNQYGTGERSTLSAAVVPQSAPPVNDSVSITAGDSVLINVLANDPVGSTLSTVGTPNIGAAVVEAGQIRYAAPADSGDSVATFTYTIVQNSNPATVTVNISAVQGAPVDDFYTVEYGTSVILDVVTNDPVGSVLESITQAPSVGSAVIDGTRILYTAPANGAASTSFQYKIANNDTPATVNITFTEPVAPPVDPDPEPEPQPTTPPTQPSPPSGGGGGGGSAPAPATPAPAPAAPAPAPAPAAPAPAPQEPVVTNVSQPPAAAPVPTTVTLLARSPFRMVIDEDAELVRSRAAARARNAPVVSIDSRESYQIRMRGLPRRERTNIQIRLRGKWVTLTEQRANRSGVINVPAITTNSEGLFLVRAVPNKGKPRFIKIHAK